MRRTLSDQERDRREISLRLHDKIAQTLLGVQVRILLLQKEARGQTVKIEKEIAETQQWIARSLRPLRRTIRARGKA